MHRANGAAVVLLFGVLSALAGCSCEEQHSAVGMDAGQDASNDAGRDAADDAAHDATDDSGPDASTFFFDYQHLMGTGDSLLDGGQELFVNCCDVGTANDSGLIHHVCSVYNVDVDPIMDFDQNTDGGLYHPSGSYVAGQSFRSFRKEDGVPGQDEDVVMKEHPVPFGQPAVSKTTGNLFLAMEYAHRSEPRTKIGWGMYFYDYGSQSFSLLFDTDASKAWTYHTPAGGEVAVEWINDGEPGLEGAYLSTDEVGGRELCVFVGRYREPPAVAEHIAVFQVDATGVVTRLFGSDDGLEVPGHPASTFSSVTRPWMSAGLLAFVGRWDGHEGIFLYDMHAETFSLVADTTAFFDLFTTSELALGLASLVVNQSGDLAFVADFGLTSEGVFLARRQAGYAPELVMRSGETQTENMTITARQFHSPALNENGQLAFAATNFGEERLVLFDQDAGLYVVYDPDTHPLTPPDATGRGGIVLSNYGLSNSNPDDGRPVLIYRHLYHQAADYPVPGASGDDVLHSMMAKASPTF